MKKDIDSLNVSFADALKKLRKEHNLSQHQLADMLFVSRSTIANWESGRRLPDSLLITRVANCLNVDVSELIITGNVKHSPKNIILVDDEMIILSGAIEVVSNALPSESVIGFTRSSEALDFAMNNHVSLAFLDIELGRLTGFSLCEKLLEINPRTNVVFLTAYPDYAFDAWDTQACGFLVKPLQSDDVLAILKKLRYPL